MVYVVVGGVERHLRVYAHRGKGLGQFLVNFGGWRWVQVEDCNLSSRATQSHEARRQALLRGKVF